MRRILSRRSLRACLQRRKAEKRFNDALEKLPAEIKRLTSIVKNKEWNTLLKDAEERAMKVTEKLEALNKKASTKKKE